MKKKGRLGQWHHKVDLLILKVFGSQGQAVPAKAKAGMASSRCPVATPPGGA